METKKYKLMKIGWLLHDFLMNEEYDSKYLVKAASLIKEMCELNLRNAENYINTYKGKKPNEIIRRGILSAFESVAVEIAKEISKVIGEKVITDGKNDMDAATIDSYANLIEFVIAAKESRVKDPTTWDMYYEDYSKHYDLAIQIPLRSFIDDDFSTVRDIIYEVFYVLSSGTFVK